MSINELYSPSEIEQMKGGQTVSKSFKDTGKQVKQVETSAVDCNELDSSSGWGSAPRVTAPGATGEKISGAAVIKGETGKPVTQSKVSAPNIQRFNKAEAKRQLDQLNAQEKLAEEQAALDPKKILSVLNAVDRRLRRLEKKFSQEAKNSQ